MRILSLVVCCILVLLATPALAGDALTFDAFYSKSGSFGGGYSAWVLAGIAAVGAGLLIFFTGGAASPIVTSIGTLIGNAAGLSGAAATSYGLALLGGGAVAAGGLGMKGGIALLTAALTFSRVATPEIVKYASYSENDIEDSSFDQSKFENRIKDLLSFPLPRSKKGTKGYKNAIKTINKHYLFEKGHSYPANRKVVDFAIFLMNERYSNSGHPRNDVALSLLHFHQGDYKKARQYADKAMQRAASDWSQKSGTPLSWLDLTSETGLWDSVVDSGNSFSLPAAIWAVSSLVDEKVDIEKNLTVLDAAIGMEPENTLTPLVISLYFSRLVRRHDIMSVSLLQRTMKIVKHRIKNVEALPSSYAVMVAQSFIAVKLKQIEISANTKKLPSAEIEKSSVIKRLENATKEYDELVLFTGQIIGNMRSNGEYMSHENSLEQIKNLRTTLNKYRDDSHRLKRLVASVKSL